MAVKMRLTRLGDKKAPFYRIVVADSRVARDAKYIDLVGTYNPLTNPEEVKIDVENNLILVKVSVPGSKKSLVTIKESVKAI